MRRAITLLLLLWGSQAWASEPDFIQALQGCERAGTSLCSGYLAQAQKGYVELQKAKRADNESPVSPMTKKDLRDDVFNKLSAWNSFRNELNGYPEVWPHLWRYRAPNF